MNKFTCKRVFCIIEGNKSIFKIIRSDKEKFNPLETAGIYRIYHIDETGEEGDTLGGTKKKTIERAGETPIAIGHKTRKNKI